MAVSLDTSVDYVTSLTGRRYAVLDLVRDLYRWDSTFPQFDLAASLSTSPSSCDSSTTPVNASSTTQLVSFLSTDVDTTVDAAPDTITCTARFSATLPSMWPWEPIMLSLRHPTIAVVTRWKCESMLQAGVMEASAGKITRNDTFRPPMYFGGTRSFLTSAFLSCNIDHWARRWIQLSLSLSDKSTPQQKQQGQRLQEQQLQKGETKTLVPPPTTGTGVAVALAPTVNKPEPEIKLQHAVSGGSSTLPVLQDETQGVCVGTGGVVSHTVTPPSETLASAMAAVAVARAAARSESTNISSQPLPTSPLLVTSSSPSSMGMEAPSLVSMPESRGTRVERCTSRRTIKKRKTASDILPATHDRRPVAMCTRSRTRVFANL